MVLVSGVRRIYILGYSRGIDLPVSLPNSQPIIISIVVSDIIYVGTEGVSFSIEYSLSHLLDME